LTEENLITRARQQAAQALVKTGRTVSPAGDVPAQPVLRYRCTFPSKRERVDGAWDGELFNGRPFAEPPAPPALSRASSLFVTTGPFDNIPAKKK
jgi:hypothetical protein